MGRGGKRLNQEATRAIKKQRGNNDGRREHSGAHPGSYAGELAALLSEERRREVDAAKAPSDRPGWSKKRVAVLTAYCGHDYKGIQMNPGQKTIEAELELAMFLAGGISSANFGNLQKLSWSRAARTDKGVHAAAQLICLKLAYPDGGEAAMTAAINARLPPAVRVMDVRRVTGSFDARNACTRRRYRYLLPTALLMPRAEAAALLGRAEAMAAGGEASEAAAAAREAPEAAAGEASEATEEVVAAKEAGEEMVVERVSAEFGAAATNRAATANGDTAVKHREQGTGGGEAMANNGGRTLSGSAAASLRGSAAAGTSRCGRSRGVGGSICDDEDEEEDDDDDGCGKYALPPAVRTAAFAELAAYRAPPARLAALRAALKQLEGTRNFHNYTAKRRAGDPACHRYIISTEVGEPFVVAGGDGDGGGGSGGDSGGGGGDSGGGDSGGGISGGDCSSGSSHGDGGSTSDDDGGGGGLEWAAITVTGQSFLLHQIRKMVAVATDVARGGCSAADVARTFGNVKVPLAPAPGAGLFLDMLFFDEYNRNLATETGRRPLRWGAESEPGTGTGAGTESGNGTGTKEGAGIAPEPAKAKANATEEWVPDAADAASAAAVDAFRRERIVGHIVRSPAARARFVGWMDAMRHSPPNYAAVAEGAAGGGGGGGGGGASTASSGAAPSGASPADA